MRALQPLVVALAAAGAHCAPPVEPACAEGFTVNDDEPYRPKFHFSPERGWMNDPNGLVFVGDEWHLFYQHNPDEAFWGNIAWGHAVSRDLVHWEHLPIALSPSEELGMVFSGSAVVDVENTSGLCDGARDCIVAVFTHAFGADGQQKQSIAVSADRGRTFVEYGGNPVLPNPGIADFRDPKVVWHAATSSWVMVLSAGDRGQIYTSPDLKAWTLSSEIGPFPSVNGTWECAELFELGGAWVLKLDENKGLGAPGSRAVFVTGAFDGATFTPASTPRDVEAGPDFYAAQTFGGAPDGRAIWIAWRDNWLYALGEPTDPWRGSLTVPRELSLLDDGAGPVLVQRPVEELLALRSDCAIVDEASLTVDGESGALDSVVGDALDIEMVLVPGDADEVGLDLRVKDPERTRVGYDRVRGVVFVDRTESGDATFHPAFTGRFEAAAPLVDGKIDVRVLVDSGSIEVFAAAGRAVLSVNIYPRPISVGMGAYSIGGAARIDGLRVWRMGGR